MEITVGISGASGVQYGIRLLEVLAEKGIKTHLVLTDAAKQIIEIETDYIPETVEKLATWSYAQKDLSAPIASGSYRTGGMVIAPCSMKLLQPLQMEYPILFLQELQMFALKRKENLS